jgi:hypothetical protein
MQELGGIQQSTKRIHAIGESGEPGSWKIAKIRGGEVT